MNIKHKNIIKNVLYFIGSALYSAIASFLIWLVYYFYAPTILLISSPGYIIENGSCIAAMIFLVLIVSIILPLIYICVNKACKIVSTIPFVVFGICAVAEPWFHSPAGVWQIVIAIALSIVAIVLFSLVIAMIWTCGRKTYEQTK